MLALGLFTAAPIVLGAADTAAWDAAAAATLLYALLALTRRVVQAALRIVPRRSVAAAALAVLALTATAARAADKPAAPRTGPRSAGSAVRSPLDSVFTSSSPAAATPTISS